MTGTFTMQRQDDVSYWNYIDSKTPKAWIGGSTEEAKATQKTHGLILKIGDTNSYKQQFKITAEAAKTCSRYMTMAKLTLIFTAISTQPTILGRAARLSPLRSTLPMRSQELRFPHTDPICRYGIRFPLLVLASES